MTSPLLFVPRGKFRSRRKTQKIPTALHLMRMHARQGCKSTWSRPGNWWACWQCLGASDGSTALPRFCAQTTQKGPQSHRYFCSAVCLCSFSAKPVVGSRDLLSHSLFDRVERTRVHAAMRTMAFWGTPGKCAFDAFLLVGLVLVLARHQALACPFSRRPPWRKAAGAFSSKPLHPHQKGGGARWRGLRKHLCPIPVCLCTHDIVSRLRTHAP